MTTTTRTGGVNGAWALAALVLFACERRGRPELAVVGLFEAAKAGDCHTLAKRLVRRSRESLERDPRACGQLIAHLNAHPIRRIQRIVPDGRSPGLMLVTATLASSTEPKTLTVAPEDDQWKVSSF